MKALRWFGWVWIGSAVLLTIVGAALQIAQAPNSAEGMANVARGFDPTSPTAWLVNVGLLLPGLFSFALARAITGIRARTADTDSSKG